MRAQAARCAIIPLLDLDHSTLGQFYLEPRRAARFSRTASARRVPRDGFGSGVAHRRDFVSVVSVTLTIRYLGSERYGAWVTITTILTFLGITDFGLGAT